MNMLLRRAFLFLFLCIAAASIVAQNSSISAAEKKSQRLVCLQAVQCNKSGAGCKVNDPHRVRLTTQQKNPTVPNEKTYILECVSTSKGQVCTTGNADTNPDLGWDINLEELKNTVNYSFEGIFKINGSPIVQLENPILSNAQGAIEAVEWQSVTSEATFHTFYALNFYEPKVIQGENTSSDCTSLRWDPYGIVFDSQTLEPIPGARISLSAKQTSGFVPANIPGVLNPITTKEDGVFNFVVPDGVYKLNATHPSYLPLPADAATINVNYSEIYSDIYPVANSANEITQVGGVAQHRDIALTPQQNTKGLYPLKVMDYYQSLEKFTNTIVIKGRVSHPFTRIKIYTYRGDSPEKARYLENDIRADKAGIFNIKVNMLVLDPGERIGGLEFEKISYTNPLSGLFNIIFREVNAQEKTTIDLPLEPIANTLEGYAYDETGKIIPNAIVGVYISFSKQPFYETTANNTGFFKITSQFLPSMPYVLQYRDPIGGTTESTLSKFLIQNSKYIETSSVKPFLYTDATGKIPLSTPSATLSGSATGSAVLSEKINQTAFIITVVIILILGIAGTVVGVHLINKKNKKA